MKFAIIISLLSVFLSGNEIPFKIGEKLIYAAKFNFIPSGEAALEIIGRENLNGIPTYHARYRVSTYPTLEKLYMLKDQVDIWMDEKELFTHKLQKKIHEGSYRKKITTTIDYKQSVAIINKDTVKIEGIVRDPYSLFYYLRSIPLKVGQLLDFSSFENKTKTFFQLSVAQTENIRTEAGNFECVLVEPFREGRFLFKNEGDMQIWFSNDTRRLPVQIQVKMKFGSMLLKLKKIEN